MVKHLKNNTKTVLQRGRVLKPQNSHNYLIINNQAKYNLFDHWCFIALNSAVCLAKIRVFRKNRAFVRI